MSQSKEEKTLEFPISPANENATIQQELCLGLLARIETNVFFIIGSERMMESLQFDAKATKAALQNVQTKVQKASPKEINELHSLLEIQDKDFHELYIGTRGSVSPKTLAYAFNACMQRMATLLQSQPSPLALQKFVNSTTTRKVLAPLNAPNRYKKRLANCEEGREARKTNGFFQETNIDKEKENHVANPCKQMQKKSRKEVQDQWASSEGDWAFYTEGPEV